METRDGPSSADDHGGHKHKGSARLLARGALARMQRATSAPPRHSLAGQSASVKIPGYTIIRELGSGGMATVYLARQDRLTREVALKVMKPLAMAGGDFTSRFVKEGQIIAQLQHPQIVTIYDFDSTDGLHYFSMEYLPGETLAEEIKQGIPTARAISLTKRIAEALAVAHARGVIHRDIKPQNILFRRDGTPVLTDFGIARAVNRGSDSTQLTSYGMVIGSPRYMSPEQSTGQPLDARSDLYSLGVVFYEMLTNQLPYEADDVVSLAMKHCTEPIPRLPEPLAVYQPILDKLIAKKPGERFASAGKLIRALEALESETLSTDGTRLVTPTEGGEQRRKRKWTRLGPLLLLAAVGLAFGVGVYLALRPPTPNMILEIIQGLPTEQPNRPKTAIQYEKLAMEHLKKGQYEQGLEIVRLGLASTAGDARLEALQSPIQDLLQAETWLAQARELQRQNLLEDGLRVVESGLQRVPKHPGLRQLETELQERIETANLARANNLLAQARARLEAGRLEEALAQVREGLGLVPDHPGLKQLQARVSSAIEERDAFQGLIRRAANLLASGALAESLQVIAEGLELAPNDPQLLDLQATARKQLQRAHERQRQREREEQVQELFAQAQALEAEAAYRDALRVIEEGLQLDPNHAGFKRLRDKVMAAQDQARRERTAQILTRARSLFAGGKLEESLALVLDGLDQDPAHPDLLALRDEIGQLREQESQVAARLQDCELSFPTAGLSTQTSVEAVSCYKEVLKLDSDRQEATDRIKEITSRVATEVESLLEGYRLDDAETALAHLHAIDPDYPRLAELQQDLSRRRGLSPRMVLITGGCFQMGSPETEPGREADERRHQACVEDFWLARLETSVAEFRRFVEATGYRTDAERGVGGMEGCWSLDQEDASDPWDYRPWSDWRNPNKYQATRDRDPVSCVSWNDTREYLRWLNRETGGAFRLPTEAEWEYAVRAGTDTARYWGDALDDRACRHANAADAGHGWADGFPCNDNREWVAEVGAFEPNAWGLSDMLGNLWEWTCSEYDATYDGAERACALSASDGPRILRGGAWNSGPGAVRSAYRNRNFPESRYNFVGFRVARDGPAKAREQ